MIKNKRQYTYTKKQCNKLQNDLKAIQKKHVKDKNKVALLSQGYKEHIKQLKSELAEFDRIVSKPLPRSLSVPPNGVNKAITQIRIQRKVTQSRLAEIIGCKQSDISRLERENFRSFSIKKLERLAKGLNTRLELKLIPERSNKTRRKETAG